MSAFYPVLPLPFLPLSFCLCPFCLCFVTFALFASTFPTFAFSAFLHLPFSASACLHTRPTRCQVWLTSSVYPHFQVSRFILGYPAPDSSSVTAALLMLSIQVAIRMHAFTVVQRFPGKIGRVHDRLGARMARLFVGLSACMAHLFVESKSMASR